MDPISQGCRFSYFRLILDANFHILSVIPHISFREGEVEGGRVGGGGEGGYGMDFPLLIGMQVFIFASDFRCKFSYFRTISSNFLDVSLI